METKIRESLIRKYLVALKTVYDLKQSGVKITRGEFTEKYELNRNFWPALRHSGLATSTNMLIEYPNREHVYILIEWFRQYQNNKCQPGIATKIPESTHIPFKIDPELLDRLKEMAGKEKRTVNNLLEFLIKDYINKVSN